LFENTTGRKRSLNEPGKGMLVHRDMAHAMRRLLHGVRHGGSACLILAMALAGPALAAEDSPRYRVGLSLMDTAPGATTGTRFSFTATSDTYEKLDLVEIDLPLGARLDDSAMAVQCQLEEEGTDAGEICPEKYPQAKIGSGIMITSVLGQHTIRGDVYVVAPQNAPKGHNLVYFFPGGQIFGASAQTLFGRLVASPQGSPVMALGNIQDQLSLPFGMSAALVEGTFTFEGQNGKPPFVNPAKGKLADWNLEIRLGWGDTVEKTSLQATLVASDAPSQGG